MILTHDHGDGIVGIQLDKGSANALDTALVDALEHAIDQAFSTGARGIVLSGTPGFFSGGADIPVLLAASRKDAHEFWRRFFALCDTLAKSPVPVAAALTGHAVAGGAVLAAFCDYRVMADGKFRIGLNEVSVGLSVPEPVHIAYRRLVGDHQAGRLIAEGTLLLPGSAQSLGLVDEVVAPEDVLDRAVAWLQTLLALPPFAFQRSRSLARAPLAAAFDTFRTAELDEFVAAYFGPEAQGVLTALAEKLSAKR